MKKSPKRQQHAISQACDNWLTARSKGLGYNIGPVTNDRRKRWFKVKMKQGKATNHMSAPTEQFGTWKIEYEVPPMRAIYFAEVDNCTEATAREIVAKAKPLWQIRKLTFKEESK